jgi:hypothetical protein
MKTKTLVLFSILCLAVLIILGSCATMKSSNKFTYVKYCGTWFNQDYEPKPGEMKPFSKLIINPDGTYLGYQFRDQSGPTFAGFYTVEKMWTDEEGNTWYHTRVYNPAFDIDRYELSKINIYNSIWELNQSNIDYPETVDPTDKYSNYRKYYRY